MFNMIKLIASFVFLHVVGGYLSPSVLCLSKREEIWRLNQTRQTTAGSDRDAHLDHEQHAFNILPCHNNAPLLQIHLLSLKLVYPYEIATSTPWVRWYVSGH